MYKLRYITSTLAAIVLTALLTTYSQAGSDQDKLNVDLMEAAFFNNYEAAVKAITHGADANYRDAANITPISWSVSNGNLQLTKYLIKHGAEILHRKNDTTTLLHLAVSPTVPLPPLNPTAKPAITTISERLAMAKYLLEKNLDPKIIDEFGAIPLHHAVTLLGDTEQQIKLIALLISHGSPLDKKNNFGLTPLDLAAKPEVKAFLASKLK